MSNLSGKGTLRGSLGAGGGSSPRDVYWDDILDKPEFAAVATSGSYNDLTDKPTPPAIMTGATAQSNGAAGYVPQPLAGDQNKFLNGGGEWVTPPSSSVNYSTNEQIIGTWVDGQPLYEKTFTGLSQTTSGQDWVTIQGINLPSVKDIINATAWAIGGTGEQIRITLAEISVVNNGIRVTIISNAFNRTINKMTVQYTKTTDALGG